MKDDRDALWTLDQLRDAVVGALAEGYDGPPNARVRDVPDQRTIRYYTTLGLIDRAAEMRGRTALYGRRHLLQLVAIKKLQAKGQTLAEVQRALAGQTDDALGRIAGLAPGRSTPGARAASRARRAFWKDAPAPACRAVGPPASDGMDATPGETDQAAPQVADGPRSLQGIALAENVTLLLASSRPLESEDLDALRSVCRPLIDFLVKLEITPSRGERGIR
jgi:DNA-binding transcriptional MerR regulator